MKESKLFRSLVATFVVIVLGGPAVVLADTPSHFDFVEDDKVAVSYADLNLDNEESVQVLYRRLQRASKKICGISPRKIYGSSVYHMWESQRCYEATLSNAVDKFDNEDLTRIHAG
ncbi:MAG: UrcA family protein [Proteobacteria bacterium]|nr:UrcA family protein [Pseudomonadota bacterium]